MKNNKGFTLIELLAIIVIMLIIATIAITSINAAIERNKNKQNITKQNVLAGYAENYYYSHRNTLGLSNCIKISYLLSEGIISEEEAKDANGTIFTGGIRYTNGKDFKYVSSC